MFIVLTWKKKKKILSQTNKQAGAGNTARLVDCWSDMYEALLRSQALERQ